MNTLAALRGPRASAFSTKLALLLIVSILFWATGMPTFLNYSKAAAFSEFSDTISDSDRSAVANHTIAATSTVSLDASDTIEITFAPGSTTAFTISGSLASADFAGSSPFTVVDSCTASPDEVTFSVTDNVLTFTVCSSDTVAAGPIVVDIANTRITNPSIADSYVIRMETFADGAGSALDSGDTRVVVIDDVVVTASVDTIFEFEVLGVANSQNVNGDTTTLTSTATALDFQTLVPNTPSIMAQELRVESNAINGFSVTLFQDGNLTSNTGADIDTFVDGAGTPTPQTWAAPTPVLGDEDTYGHFGITSDDSDFFGAQEYAGDIDTPREVYSESTPVSFNATLGGQAFVGFQIEISSLQEAGNDYTNTLTYVATPTF